MGTGKKQQQSAKGSKANTPSGDIAGGLVVDCKHIKHAINPGQVIRGVKDNELGVCEDCRANGTLAEHEGGSVWICLKCGHQGCGRTSPEQHARIHGELERGELHCIAMEITSKLLWCYKCDSDLVGRPDGKLKTCIDALVKITTAHQPPVDGPPVVKASGAVVATDASDTSNSSTTSVVSTAQQATHPRGFRNLGNTCFFNAALQCLCQTPFMVEALEQCRASDRVVLVKPRYPSCSGDGDTTLPYPADDTDVNEGKTLTLELSSPSGPMTNALLAFIKEARGASKHELSPKALFAQICDKAPRFRGFQQQDSHELLRYLLDGIKTEETKRMQDEILKQFKVKRSEPVDQVDGWVKRQVKAYGKGAKHTLVDSFFGGHFISVITCLECHHMSHIFEPFLDISLPVFEDKIESKQSKFNKQQESKQQETASELDSLGPSTKQSKNSMKKNQKKARKEQRRGKNRRGQQQRVATDNETEGGAHDKEGEEEEEHGSDDADDEEQKDGASESAATASSTTLTTDNADSSSRSVNVESSEPFGNSEAGSKPGNTESTDSKTNSQEVNGLCDTLQNKLSLASGDTVLNNGDHLASSSGVDGLTTALQDKLSLEGKCVGGDTAACLPTTVSNDGTTVNCKSAESSSIAQADSATNSNSRQQDNATRQHDLSTDSSRPELASRERGSSGSNDSGVSVDGSYSLSDQKSVLSLTDDGGLTPGESSSTVGLGKAGSASTVGIENDNERRDDHNAASYNDDDDELDQTIAYNGDDESCTFADGATTEYSEKELLVRALQPLASSDTIRDSQCSIQSSLRAFTAVERLSGANRFCCPKCSKRALSSKKSAGGKPTPVLTDADKNLLLVQPPAVLTLHLKRFQQTGYSLRKISKHIDFPLTLDMAPFTSSLYLTRRCFEGEEERPATLPYSLYGVVEHSGTMTGGHYVAYVRHSQHLAQDKDEWMRQLAEYDLSGLRVAEVADKLARHVAASSRDAETGAEERLQQSRDGNGGEFGRWYYVSDSSVRQCDISDVLRCNAYLLFYRRVVPGSI